MIRRRKKNTIIEGELSLFSAEHWESLEDSPEQGGSGRATPGNVMHTTEAVETTNSIEPIDTIDTIEKPGTTEDIDEGVAAEPDTLSDGENGKPQLETMKWAIGYVRRLDLDTTRLLAMETSMMVQSDYHPDHLYVVNTLHGERMNGLKVGTLCYASFMRAFPSMIEHLNLNYYDIYQAALADD